MRVHLALVAVMAILTPSIASAMGFQNMTFGEAYIMRPRTDEAEDQEKNLEEVKKQKLESWKNLLEWEKLARSKLSKFPETPQAVNFLVDHIRMVKDVLYLLDNVEFVPSSALREVRGTKRLMDPAGFRSFLKQYVARLLERCDEIIATLLARKELTREDAASLRTRVADTPSVIRQPIIPSVSTIIAIMRR